MLISKLYVALLCLHIVEAKPLLQSNLSCAFALKSFSQATSLQGDYE